MKYNDLVVSSNRSSNRVGRGIAANQGKTAGRGTKGQKSRSGSSRKPGFEGGRNPLLQQLPKLPGFNSHKVKMTTVYTGEINKLSKIVDNKALADAGLIDTPYLKVKLIVNGDVTKALEVKLQGASESAVKAIKKAGGSFVVVDQVGRSKSPDKKAPKV